MGIQILNSLTTLSGQSTSQFARLPCLPSSTTVTAQYPPALGSLNHHCEGVCSLPRFAVLCDVEHAWYSVNMPEAALQPHSTVDYLSGRGWTQASRAEFLSFLRKLAGHDRPRSALRSTTPGGMILRSIFAGTDCRMGEHWAHAMFGGVLATSNVIDPVTHRSQTARLDDKRAYTLIV